MVFYEVYIDIFFCVNAMLDYFIILIVKKVQHYKSTPLRTVLAAMIGSMLLCVFLCIPVRRYLFVQIGFYIAAYTAMAAVAFPECRGKGRLRAVLILYIVSLLVNGIFQWLRVRVEHTYGLLAACSAVYMMLRGLYFLYAQRKEKEQNIYKVRICYKGQTFDVDGLWDTGNRLRSPYHGRGISIISYESIENYLSDALRRQIKSGESGDNSVELWEERMFYVVYESVGCTHGLLPVLQAEEMTIEKKEETVVYQNPLLGISRMPVSTKKAFQVILTTGG